MFPSGDVLPGRSAATRRWCAWLSAIILLGLGSNGATLPAWPESHAEPSRAPATVFANPSPIVDPTVVTPVASTSLTPVAAASSQPASDQQRRMLMLLLMNSAGRLGPFGGLGH